MKQKAFALSITSILLAAGIAACESTTSSGTPAGDVDVSASAARRHHWWHHGGSGTGGSSGSSGFGGSSGSSGSSGFGGSGGSSGSIGSAGDGGSGGVGGSGGTGGTTGASAMLHASGRFILDRCGNKLVVRGVEQVLGNQLPPGNDFPGQIDKIAQTGANAVRILPDLGALSLATIDATLARAGADGMVVYVSPGDRSWFGQQAVRDMLAKHRGYILLDGLQEPNYSDRARWKSDAIAAIAQIRSYGYDEPITVMSNQYGRDLPSTIAEGASVVATDPQHNTIIGWQAYWGNSGWYQSDYKLTLTQAVAAVAGLSFPVQIGIDHFADPNDAMDYGQVMTAAQTQQVGWLWWDWYNPYGNANNLSKDGSATNLFPVGTEVVTTHSASIAKTSVKACKP